MNHFGPEKAYPHNSGLALRIFLKLCRMKGANRYIKILLVVFSRKKFILGCLIFLAFMSFFTVWLDMVNLSKATANWILKQSRHDFFHDYYWILKQSGYDLFHDYYWILRLIRILNQWRHDFSGKHLCDGYCMDVMWCLCRYQNSWFKASLRICYASLSECKSHWMLETHKLPCVEQKITKLDWKKTMYSVVKLSSYFCV